MMPRGLRKYEGPNVTFRGTLAVEKRLKSAGMRVLRCAGIGGGVWRCETDRGPRLVSHRPDGWKIVNPAA